MSVSDPLQQLQKLAGRMVGKLARLPVHHLLGWRPDRSPRVPGAAPGTVFERTGALPTRITAFRYTAEEATRLDSVDPEKLAAARDGSGRLWIDIAGLADVRTILKLARLFGIHRLAVADAINTPQRPKAQRIGDQRLVITQMPHLDSETHTSELAQVALVFGSDFLISIREYPDDSLRPIIERLRAEDSRIRGETVDYLAYALLDWVTDSYFPVVESLSGQIGDLEDRVMEETGGSLLTHIHSHRHSLILMSRVLWRNRDMVNSLLRSEEYFPARLHVYLQDLHDHSIQLLDMVETIRELANSLVEIHLAISGNRMNQIMKTLTIMASIFIPLTFLAGIYGMNFEVMPELAVPWAYPALLVVMAVIGIGLTVWFWRRGWIGRD